MNKQLEVVQKAINYGDYTKPTTQAEAAWNAVIDELIEMDWSKLSGAEFHRSDKSNRYNTVLDAKAMLQQMKQGSDEKQK